MNGCEYVCTQTDRDYIIQAYHQGELIAETRHRELTKAVDLAVEEIYRQWSREVMEEGGWRCAACGQGFVALQCDHVVPRSLRRDDRKSNLRPLCYGCHERKHRG